MNEFLPFVIVGLASGAIYGLAGVGLILSYRTSGVFNFAHGAVASMSAYLFYELQFRHGVPWFIALVATAVFVGVVGGIGLEYLARSLSGARAGTKVVATVGLLVAIQGIITVIYGPTVRNLPQYLPDSSFRLLDVNVGYDQLIVVVVGIVLTAGLSALLRASRLGIAMRGSVDNPALLELTGLSSRFVQRSAWVLGTSIAAASGVLIAPSIGLDPLLLSFLVVQAFGAAAIGRFKSLELTFAGGLLLGVVASVGQKYASDFPSLLGLPPSVPFIVLFALLTFARPGTLREVGEVRRTRVTDLTRPPTVVVYGALAVFGAAVLVVPQVVTSRLPVYTAAAAYVIVFLALGLIVTTSGQISLCHAAFVAVGGTTFSQLTLDAGVPWFIALIGAGLAAVPIGLLVALPAVRLPGVYLALATFGLGILMERMVYRTFLMFGSEGSRRVPRPDLPGFGVLDDDQFYYLAVALAVATCVLVIVLQRTRLGRMLRSLADSPGSLVAFGASPTAALVVVFCITSFIAAAGGGVLAAASGTTGPSSLGALNSLLWVTVLAISGRRVIPAAIITALLVSVMPIYLPFEWVDYQAVAFGMLAVVVAIVRARGFDLAEWLNGRIVQLETRPLSPFRRDPRRQTQPVEPTEAVALG